MGDDMTTGRLYNQLRIVRHIGLAVLLVLIASPARSEEKKEERALVLVTHPKNPIIEITKRELGRIYLKKQRYWLNGDRCVPIDQAGSSQSRKDFYRIVLNKDPYEMKRYWMQETMTGNANPPVTLDNPATVKRYIRKIQGGIGYIYADEVDDTVKVLHVIDIPELNSLEEETDAQKNDEASSKDTTPKAP